MGLTPLACSDASHAYATRKCLETGEKPPSPVHQAARVIGEFTMNRLASFPREQDKPVQVSETEDRGNASRFGCCHYRPQSLTTANDTAVRYFQGKSKKLTSKFSHRIFLKPNLF
ncbi:hypothetical protein NPIL_160901 [Nephila pilipes]|uniref:Uncharacterized protein n=1 Tax=Nephila pilipes TaxID=299642 RepID=A0A8X6NCG8_NEPPI|nr:hypothetical protein NPIL_160901 [Nephila pilipes]